jgi:hypothetical protein
MTNTPNKDRAAFSVSLRDNGNARHADAMGLTKREYYAGLALQGLLANTNSLSDVRNQMMAKVSVKLADQLLTELEKK